MCITISWLKPEWRGLMRTYVLSVWRWSFSLFCVHDSIMQVRNFLCTCINQPPIKWRKTNKTCPAPLFDNVLLGCKGGTGHSLCKLLAWLYEYWMIYRGPGCLAVVWVGSSPTPSPTVPSASSLSCSVFYSVLLVELTDGRRGGGEEPNHMTSRKPGHLQIIQYSLAWLK